MNTQGRAKRWLIPLVLLLALLFWFVAHLALDTTTSQTKSEKSLENLSLNDFECASETATYSICKTSSNKDLEEVVLDIQTYVEDEDIRPVLFGFIDLFGDRWTLVGLSEEGCEIVFVLQREDECHIKLINIRRSGFYE